MAMAGATSVYVPSLSPTRLPSASSLRCADVTAIRSWLGHAQLDTIDHYAQANLETKPKALGQVDPKLGPAKPPRWKRYADLLAWLDSL